MENLTKTCQNCKSEFRIESEDFKYYEKIGVPPPTFCFYCRLQRKMARRNERSLYQRTCDLCKKSIIAMYPAESPYTVYCNACWWSDKWEGKQYGRDYDFSKSFFEQWHDLSLKVPRLALYQKNPENSEYTNHTDRPKDCYLTFDTGFSEKIMYSKWIVKAKDMLDCYGTIESERVYWADDCSRCSRSAYLWMSADCFDSFFLYNCKGCQNCFMSTNLRNKSYCFENKQLTKDEYEKRMRELDLGNFKVLQYLYQKFWDDIMLKTPRRHLMILNSVDSSGDFMHNCKNVRHSFRVSESEDSAYSVDASNLKDCYDAYEPAFDCVQQYDCHACNRLSYSKFCSISYDNHHLEYCEMCHGSSELFGCIGLRNKQYYILNKQYTKEEYQALVAKIREQMQIKLFVDAVGRSYRYGEFFPIQHSPFAYNETVAQEYFPLTKEKAEEQGFVWHERGARDHKITKSADDLPVNIKDVPDVITNEVIGCAHQGSCQEQCTTAFKIIAQELEFYRSLGLPLPRLCPNCRHYERLHRRNPMRLWHRQCTCEVTQHLSHVQGRCGNEFETTYAPDRPEKVYCESCYQAEVL